MKRLLLFALLFLTGCGGGAETPWNDPHGSLTVRDVRVVRGDDYTIHVQGLVDNDTPQAFTGIKIEFEISQKDGPSLGTVEDSTSWLDSHSGWRFDARSDHKEEGDIDVKFVRLSKE